MDANERELKKVEGVGLEPGLRLLAARRRASLPLGVYSRLFAVTSGGDR